MDLVSGAKRVIVAMTHTAKGKPKIVQECTLPLTAARRVSLIVTEMAVIEPTADGLLLKELAPGITVTAVRQATEADLIIRTMCRRCGSSEFCDPDLNAIGRTMKLYDYFRSSAAYRVRIALNLKGLAYERHEVHLVRDGGEHLKADYRAINPQARVPALELDNGTILTQSPAILEWIEETHPEPPLRRPIPFCVPASAPSPPSSPATSTQSTT